MLETCQPQGTCECLHIVKIPLGEVVEFVIADSGKFFYFILENMVLVCFQIKDTLIRFPIVSLPGRLRNTLSHPFHVHGNYFHVLALGLFESGQTIADIFQLLDRGEIPFSLHPIEKDTIAIPAGGYAVARMVANNPGVCSLTHSIAIAKLDQSIHTVMFCIDAIFHASIVLFIFLFRILDVPLSLPLSFGRRDERRSPGRRCH